MATIFATLTETSTGEQWQLYKYSGASAPMLLSYCPVCCGYWESRYELLEFAARQLEKDPAALEWLDGFTGEILTAEELQEEEYNLLEEVL